MLADDQRRQFVPMLFQYALNSCAIRARRSGVILPMPEKPHVRFELPPASPLALWVT